MLQKNAISDISPDTPGFFSNIVLHFSLNTAPHVLTCLGHTVAPFYLHHQGISVIPYRNNWSISSFCGFHYSWIRGELPSQYPKLGRYGTCRAKISSQKTLSHREVSQFMGSLNWASGLIPLGHLHFHSLGLTNRFSTPRRSDPVTLLRQWQDLSFLTSGIPI